MILNYVDSVLKIIQKEKELVNRYSLFGQFSGIYETANDEVIKPISS
jgi:hypothetical protein